MTQAFNKVIRGIHGVAERANALLKVTFKALRGVSLDPAAITRIARAALVLLQLEHPAPPDGQSQTAARRYREGSLPGALARPPGHHQLNRVNTDKMRMQKYRSGRSTTRSAPTRPKRRGSSPR